MKTFTTKLQRPLVEGLKDIIENLLQQSVESDDDKLIMAGLAEIKHRLYLKLERNQQEYQISFSPVQALALRLLYTDYIANPKTYMGSHLHLLSNEIHQHYS